MAVHVRDRIVGSFECAVGDEAVAFAETGLISCNLGGRLEGAEAGECVVKGFLVDEGVEVSYEELGAYFDGFLLVRRGLFCELTSISFANLGRCRKEDEENWGRYTLLTRIGFPYNRTWFMIRAAYSASSSLMNSTKPYP